jgi:succinate dehydrogenase/fumarate reductase flavoprotein subunit
MPDLVVAGAGMGGLVAAVRARELGADVVVLEKGDRAGGSMRLSGGYAWRYRDWERFREECPGGDEALQRLVWERFDEALEWLRAKGAPILTEDMENPLTVGVRLDVDRVPGALAAQAGDVRLAEPLDALPDGVPVVLATGGFHAGTELVRRYITPEADELVLRGNPWSEGTGIELGLAAGASLTDGMDEFWGRAMPAPPAVVEPSGYRSLGQTYARFARVVNERGEEYRPRSWSEIDVAQWIAHQPRGRAWFHVPDDALSERVRDRTVAEMIESAREAGASVERRDGETVVEVVAGITTTLGGLAVDTQARAAEGVWVAGADAGGISTGGWASGLASALVLGLAAAESALGHAG